MRENYSPQRILIEAQFNRGRPDEACHLLVVWLPAAKFAPLSSSTFLERDLFAEFVPMKEYCLLAELGDEY